MRYNLALQCRNLELFCAWWAMCHMRVTIPSRRSCLLSRNAMSDPTLKSNVSWNGNGALIVIHGEKMI